jgi:hypothetical protein
MAWRQLRRLPLRVVVQHVDQQRQRRDVGRLRQRLQALGLRPGGWPSCARAARRSAG